MPAFIAMLRAVNVGGTGKLPMATLKSFCEEAGLTKVRTYITSGNVLFDSRLSEAKVKALLEARLLDDAGRKVDVLVRTAAEMEAVVTANPFADRPGNNTVAIFLDDAPPADAIEKAVGCDDAVMALGEREMYVAYGKGMGTSKLRIPAAKAGTARNMNTVAKLAAMAGSPDP